MLLSAVSVLVVAQSSSEIPEGLMNNPVYRVTWRWPSKRAETCRQPNNKVNACKPLCCDSL